MRIDMCTKGPEVLEGEDLVIILHAVPPHQQKNVGHTFPCVRLLNLDVRVVEMNQMVGMTVLA